MKLRVIMVVLALTLALSAQGCQGFKGVRGSGRVVEDERSVSDLTGVSMAGMGNL